MLFSLCTVIRLGRVSMRSERPTPGLFLSDQPAGSTASSPVIEPPSGSSPSGKQLEVTGRADSILLFHLSSGHFLPFFLPPDPCYYAPAMHTHDTIGRLFMVGLPH